MFPNGMAPLKAILLAFALSALQAHAWVTMASTSIAATPTSKAATTAKAAKLSSLSSQVSGSTKLAATSTAAGTSGAKAVAGTAAKKTASASAAKFSANAAASKAAAASAAKISASNAKISASSAAASKAAAASAASVNAGVAATGAAVAASGAAFSAGIADAGASVNSGIADLVSSAELAFASMSVGEAAGVVALAVAAGVIVGQSNQQGGNGTVATFRESAAVSELRAMNEQLSAKVVGIEDKFVAADAAFEANTEAMRKEFDTTLRVKIDTLRSELQRDKEAALKDMQNAHELQLEEMKSFYTDQYAEKVSELQREITERDKRILELEAAAGDPLSRWFKVRGGGERAEPMSPAYSRVTVARGGGGGVPCRHRVLGKEAGSQTPRGRGQRRPSRRARAWRLTRSSPRLRGKG